MMWLKMIFPQHTGHHLTFLSISNANGFVEKLKIAVVTDLKRKKPWVFPQHYEAVMKYVSQGPMLVDVHMHQPLTNSRNFMDSLLAFWPGLQVSSRIPPLKRLFS